MYNSPDYAKPYYVVMTGNCLDDKAQFRYLDSELLQHIETGGTLVSSPANTYNSRWAVYKGISDSAMDYQTKGTHRLEQTTAGSLRFYQDGICAEPETVDNYIIRKTYCDKPEQEFTFGK